MTSTDYSNIRQELERLRQDSPKATRRTPVFDFGLSILLYLCAVVLVVTAMLLAGLPLQRYTALYAVPFVWLGLTLLRKAPVYALMITALGAAALAACAFVSAQVFDVAADSTGHIKLGAGMLAYGWNPFSQTMAEFAASTDALPFTAYGLAAQAGTQPIAPAMFSAALTALTGGIVYGKAFNIAGMIAAVCIVAPLLRDAFHLNTLAAFAAALLVSVNPVTLGQALSYYSDGLVFQMLTIAAAAFASLAMRPNGRYANAAKATAFTAVCMAMNIRFSALLFASVLCLLYFIVRMVSIAQSNASYVQHRKQRWGLLLYFAVMAVAALGVLGAGTYVVNFLRYGNPLHGVLSSLTASAQLSPAASHEIGLLYPSTRFLLSLVSPVSNGVFAAIAPKIPFTLTMAELNLQTAGANIGGWGILFSGIFLLSLVVILITVIASIRRGTRRAILLVVLLLTVFLPVLVMPMLFQAANYLQLFWLPAAALVCLFAPREYTGITSRRVFNALLGLALALLLVANCVTGYNYITMQIEATAETRETLAAIRPETETGGKTMDAAPMTGGQYYGQLFTLTDEGIAALNYIATIPDTTGTVLQSLSYHLRDTGNAAEAGANAFLASLNQNGYLVAVAKQGACGALTADMLSLLETAALHADAHNSLTDTYLAVISTGGAVLAEESGAAAVSAAVQADALQVQVQSAPGTASVTIDGVEYALGRDGYNIVVFDPQTRTLVTSVVINTENTPALSR